MCELAPVPEFLIGYAKLTIGHQSAGLLAESLQQLWLDL